MHSDDSWIAAHIASVASSTRSDLDRLSSAMLGHCWPGGVGVRTEDVALEWVRRWGSRALGTLPHVCHCRQGRCLICN